MHHLRHEPPVAGREVLLGPLGVLRGLPGGVGEEEACSRPRKTAGPRPVEGVPMFSMFAMASVWLSAVLSCRRKLGDAIDVGGVVGVRGRLRLPESRGVDMLVLLPEPTCSLIPWHLP